MTDNIKSKNIKWQESRVSAAERQSLLRHRGCVIWLTGLSGSGKSTIASQLEERLVQDRHLAYVLDGDNVRHGLNKDLGFSAEDRDENIRRIGEVAAMFARAGVMTITAFISPYLEGRQNARRATEPFPFIEVFLNAPLETCEQRDPKGLYQKARQGLIKNFTGIDAPYEHPDHPEIILDTDKLSVRDCVEQIERFLQEQDIIFS